MAPQRESWVKIEFLRGIGILRLLRNVFAIDWKQSASGLLTSSNKRANRRR
jgi:hypothetical protein